MRYLLLLVVFLGCGHGAIQGLRDEVKTCTKNAVEYEELSRKYREKAVHGFDAVEYEKERQLADSAVPMTAEEIEEAKAGHLKFWNGEADEKARQAEHYRKLAAEKAKLLAEIE